MCVDHMKKVERQLTAMAVYSVKLSCQATLCLWDLQAFLEIPLPCAIIPVFFPQLDRLHCISIRHTLELLWRNIYSLLCLSSPQFSLIYIFHSWTNSSIPDSADLLFHYCISMLTFLCGVVWRHHTSVSCWQYHPDHTQKTLALFLMVFSLLK